MNNIPTMNHIPTMNFILTMEYILIKNCCSFKSCIKQSVRSKVGCKMPWHDEAVIGVNYFLSTRLDIQFFLQGRVCSNITEYEEFEALYKDLSLKDKDFIEGSTGCLYPCNYLEYRSTLFKIILYKVKPVYSMNEYYSQDIQHF